MQYEDIRGLVKDDLTQVDHLIAKHLNCEISLVKSLGGHIVNSGGKRIRPLVTLLAAHSCSYSDRQHIPLATLVEFIHTATLLHDDVVDASALRRGDQTANQIWGNEASVLVGDFLFSRSFQMMVEIGNLTIMKILANTTNALASGEVMQLMHLQQIDLSEQHYLQVIQDKTAVLFAAAAQISALIAQQTPTIENALRDYGTHLGTAFQLVDDALDYCGQKNMIGKNIGDDLAEGKITLPLIHALKKGNSAQQKIIQDAIEQKSLKNLQQIQQTIASTGAIEYTYQAAQQQAELAIQALRHLPESPYRLALEQLAFFAVARNH
jgi:octaprenyl-diphosphate synthase